MTNRKNDTRYHEILKQASIYVYHNGNAQLPAGYRIINKAENKKNGFYAEAYSNGKDIIIAYRGTDDINSDGNNDVAMIKTKIPNQAADAIAFHDKIQRENPNLDIVVTGHSLGGSLSEIVSAIRKTLAITFNAYGIRDMFKQDGFKAKEDNIVNYINEWDPFTMFNAENNLGEIYAVQNITKNLSKTHYCEAMGSLQQRETRSIEDIKKHQNFMYRIRNKVIHKVSECVGSYFVSGYTREDGTKINGYTRTCGAKHNN